MTIIRKNISSLSILKNSFKEVDFNLEQHFLKEVHVDGMDLWDGKIFHLLRTTVQARGPQTGIFNTNGGF